MKIRIFYESGGNMTEDLAVKYAKSKFGKDAEVTSIDMTPLYKASGINPDDLL